MKQLFTIVASSKRYYTRNQPTNQTHASPGTKNGIECFTQ